MLHVMNETYNCLAPGQIVSVKVEAYGDIFYGTIICQPYSAMCVVGKSGGDRLFLFFCFLVMQKVPVIWRRRPFCGILFCFIYYF